MASLIIKSRSFADSVASNLTIIFQEAGAYLDASHIDKRRTKEIVDLCIKDWNAYEWIGGSLDGRVRGTAGANEMRSQFALLSAALAHYYADRAIHILATLASCEKESDACDFLISNNPGDRQIPFGLNAASGAAMLVRCAQLSERAITNHRIALRLSGLDDLTEVEGRARRMLKELERRKVNNTANAKKGREAGRTPNHEEIEAAFLRLIREGHTRREANGMLYARGLAARSTINRYTKRIASDR